MISHCDPHSLAWGTYRDGAWRDLGWRTVRPSWELPEKDRLRLSARSVLGDESDAVTGTGVVMAWGEPLALEVRE